MTFLKSTLITLFAVPKPFEGATDRIQRNAMASWKALGSSVRVVLMGDEAGTADLANDFGFEHVADLRRNQEGTPLLSDAFAKASRLAQTPFTGYVNADIILLPDFLTALENAQRQIQGEMLLIGRRTELDLDNSLDFEDPSQYQELSKSIEARGRLGAVVCKDYFVFRTGQYRDLPAFAVGRGNWDNWMVASTKRRGVPVVEATAAITAVHQTHDYGHLRGGRRAAYLTGTEARSNQRLAGGRNLVAGCDTSHRMSAGSGTLIPTEARPFWSDLRSVLGLAANLAFGR